MLAGGDGTTAIRLAVGMLALQASIGALNDLIDAPIDAGRKPAKPIPAGSVAPDLARVVVVGSAAAGLLLSVPSGPGLVVLAGIVLAIGYGYDLAAKGTPWSWVPFALGVPLLPVYGWYGAAGTLPAAFVLLVPVACMAGAALAIANALADAGRDRSAGVGSVAIRLGPRRAWVVGLSLHSIVGLVAVGSLAISGTAAPAIVGAILSAGLVLAGAVLGRSSSARRLERAWEVQAIGIALLGAIWLLGIAGSG